MRQSVSFFVPGVAIPKQSFRFVKGGGYTSPLVKAWQKTVSQYAQVAMVDKDMFLGNVSVEFQFFLPNNRRKDWDNLSKCVSDALNGIVYKDDSQVVMAHIEKAIDKIEYGVFILVIGEE